MKRHLITASLAVIGAALLSSNAFAQEAVDSVTHTQWDENPYRNAVTGGALPSGIVIGYTNNPANSPSADPTFGFYSGRTIATATNNITINTIDGSLLNTIHAQLYTGTTDAHLYEVQIPNPSSFTISMAFGTGNRILLSLYDSNGNAIAAAIGGTTGQINPSNTTLPGAGLYWIGVSTVGQYPQNANGQSLFSGLTDPTTGLIATGGSGVVEASATTGLTGTYPDALSTDPYIAFHLPLGDSSPLVTSTTLTSNNFSNVLLSGVEYTPEPTSLCMLGTVSFGLLARRRRSPRRK